MERPNTVSYKDSEFALKITEERLWRKIIDGVAINVSDIRFEQNNSIKQVISIWNQKKFNFDFELLFGIDVKKEKDCRSIIVHLNKNEVIHHTVEYPLTGIKGAKHKVGSFIKVEHKHRTILSIVKQFISIFLILGLFLSTGKGDKIPGLELHFTIGAKPTNISKIAYLSKNK